MLRCGEAVAGRKTKKKGFPLHDRCLLFILLTCHRLIQHVMSGRSSHSYNSPFCYVLLCVCVCSFALSRTPARHEADVRPAPVRTYRHTRLHIHQHRYQTCLFVVFFFFFLIFFLFFIEERTKPKKVEKKTKTNKRLVSFLFIVSLLLLPRYVGCCITMKCLSALLEM